jgi:hypothetical protein
MSKTMCCLWRLLMPVLLIVPLDAAAGMPGADEKWRHFQSEHFELYSRNSESDSRLLLHNLEQVHAIFFETFGFTPIRALPITVYFFSREKHFEAYKPEDYTKVDNIATFYHQEPDRGIMTVAPLPSYEAAQQLAFGSYTYHLFRLIGEPPPAWYGYGVSGLFRNLVLTFDKLEMGKADPNQVRRLREADLIPVDALFGSDQKSSAFRSNQGNSLFHDESWAMVHYLYFGQHKLPRQGVSAFVNHALLNARTFDAAETRGVFEQQLGFSYEKMNAELQLYIRNGRYGYNKLPLPQVPPAKSYALRKVGVEEIDLRLAELALRVNQSPAGKLALLHAADRPAEAVRSNEVLGAAAAREGDWDQAVDRWERALAAGSTNPAVMHELCQHEGRLRFQRFDLYYRLPDDDAARLRTLLDKSIAAAPQQTAGYELLAWVEATAREPRVRNVNLVQQNFPRLKVKDRTLLALAVVRLRLGDKAGATELLDALEKGERSDWVRYGIEHTRAQLEDRPVNRANLPKGAPRRTSPVPPLRMQIGQPPG